MKLCNSQKVRVWQIYIRNDEERIKKQTGNES